METLNITGEKDTYLDTTLNIADYAYTACNSHRYFGETLCER